MKSEDIFNKDITETGQYRYTVDKKSSVIATGIQTKELLAMIQRHTPRLRSILDVGCGDGTYTFELIRALHPKKVVAFDPAAESIKYAKKVTPKEFKKIVTFQVKNLYDIASFVKPTMYDAIVIRGVLHHLDEPQLAIQELSKVAKNLYILEPSGYNPILKIIEKTSAYHIAHGEKSYFPPTLNRWLTTHGYQIEEQKFFSIVPYFAPDWLVDVLVSSSEFFESIPFVSKLYCGTNLLYAKKIFPKI